MTEALGTAVQEARKPASRAKTSTSLLSGAISGLASCVLLQPLDLLKTRLQQDRLQSALSGPQNSGNAQNQVTKAALTARPRLVKAFQDVVRNDGLVGLWRGTTPTIARNAPGVSLYFAAINYLRAVLPNTSYGHAAAGALARTSVGFALMPATVVKTRMESSLFSRMSLLDTARSIKHAHGWRGFFTGFWPTTMRDAPTAAIFLTTYERTRSVVKRQAPSINAAVVDSATGAFAAGASTLITAPFDTLKTRRQLQPTLYTGLVVAAQRVYTQDGVVGFFRGVSLRCARKAASSGIAWGLYEFLLRKWAPPR